MSTLLRRLVVSLAASAGLVFGLAGPAAATAPYIGTFAFDESGVDDGATAD
jgi:hypothetical protein